MSRIGHVLGAAAAFDALFTGDRGAMVAPCGRVETMNVHHWRADPDSADRQLFLDPCDGPTLDVGCGPGRLVGELIARRVPALGIDVSLEAVRQARSRGALALRRDVFSAVPGQGRWDLALLADGNVGIGGEPVRLLRRMAELLRPGGRVLAEVAAEGTGLVREHRRIRIDGRLTGSFAWAVVGLDAIEEVAVAAGLRLIDTRTVDDRHVVTLRGRCA